MVSKADGASSTLYPLNIGTQRGGKWELFGHLSINLLSEGPFELVNIPFVRAGPTTRYYFGGQIGGGSSEETALSERQEMASLLSCAACSSLPSPAC